MRPLSSAAVCRQTGGRAKRPVLFEASLSRAGLPGEIGLSQRSRWRILSLRSAAESHGQRSASPSLEGLPRRLHALSQSPQQPRWPRCINLLLSPAQGESWRSFSCFVPTSSASRLRWNIIGSHEQAHLLCRVRDELMQRCRLSSMPSSLPGELDGSSERTWDVWTVAVASGCWKSVSAPRFASFARPDRCIHGRD